jgi:hypothetical protein
VSICDRYIKFSGGCEEVSNLLHAHVQPIAVCDVDACHVKQLILGNRQITVHNIAFNSSISVGSVEEVVHKQSLFNKM